MNGNGDIFMYIFEKFPILRSDATMTAISAYRSQSVQFVDWLVEREFTTYECILGTCILPSIA